MTSDFRFVIVGSGNIAGTYIKAINNCEGVKVVGGISRSGRKPDGAPDDFDIASSFEDLKCEYDAVILAVPNGLHHVWTLAAAELGKHVLTEKSLDVSLEHMDTMIAACKKHNVKLGVTYQKRMYPDNRRIKEMIDSGCFGRIFAADLKVKCYRDQAYYNSAPYRGGYEIDGGGPFIQQASHNIDILAWFFGKPVKTVSMLGTFLHDIEVEDHGTALLKYENGMMATITASTATWPGFPPELTVHCEKGTFSLVDDVIADWQVQGVDKPEIEHRMNVHSGANSAAVSKTEGHEAIIQDFVDAVRNDREPFVSGRDARLATEIALEIYHANIY